MHSFTLRTCEKGIFFYSLIYDVRTKNGRLVGQSVGSFEIMHLN